jgi:hypothetical protein
MLLVIRNKISVSRSITINAQEKNHVLWFNAGNILRIWCTVLSSEALVFLASDSEVSRRAWPTSENNVFSCIRSCVVSVGWTPRCSPPGGYSARDRVLDL